MTPFSEELGSGAWLMLASLLVVWIVVTVDIIRSPLLSTWARVAWIVACSLVWPAMALYLLVRPQQARVQRDEGRTDAHYQLVSAVLDREAGRIDDAQWPARVRALRAVSGRSPG